MNKFISVIVPVYNDSAAIAIALDALCKQDYPDSLYEIIPVDNASTDDTKNILALYAKKHPKLIYPSSEDEIQSSYAARNRGIEVAKGSVLAFTDADCIPHEYWLSNGLKGLNDNGASFAAGRIQMTFEKEKPNIWEYIDAAGKLNQKKYVEKSGFGATANLFVYRDIINKYGCFNDKLQSGGDYEFGRRLTNNDEKLVYVEDAVIYHPARKTFKEKLKKSQRVAKGQYMLNKLGLVNTSAIKLRDFIPIRKVSEIPGVKLGRIKKIIIIITTNLFKYYNLVVRLGGKFSS